MKTLSGMFKRFGEEGLVIGNTYRKDRKLGKESNEVFWYYTYDKLLWQSFMYHLYITLTCDILKDKMC